ncbi:helix-turn-helix domain-containing protein [Krasilnikovia sp. MM14-A1259]|uniref:helix-turn-helix domain-containing protein n=1 Tax=Krasilnikovia sp. MM14-A1259 TaxID=3373539 RepID=UPI0038189D08
MNDDDPLQQRMHAAGLSLWELGDLLGVHPHHLHRYDTSGGLAGQSVRTLIELAARLDLHPADLVPALEPVLANRREPPAAARAADLDTDALAVLTALATSSVPLTAEELATALTWPLDRVAAALHHAADQPSLAGPVALRRIPPATWTITARRDILTTEQQQAVTEAAGYRNALTVNEANVLLAAHALGNTPDYAGWRQEHLDTEQQLKTAGLLRCINGPHHAELHPDVVFSLSRYQ